MIYSWEKEGYGSRLLSQLADPTHELKLHGCKITWLQSHKDPRLQGSGMQRCNDAGPCEFGVRECFNHRVHRDHYETTKV